MLDNRPPAAKNDGFDNSNPVLADSERRTMDNVNHLCKKIGLIVLPIIIVYVTHYASTNLYANICADLGFIGFIKSFVTAGSPICNALLSVINTTHNSYSVLITGLIVGFTTFLASLH